MSDSKKIMAEAALIISEENRSLFSSLSVELNSLRQSLQELDITCCCTESDCPFRVDYAVGSRRHYPPEAPPQSPVSPPKTSIKRWVVYPNRRGAAATDPRPRPKSAILYLPDDLPPYELIKQKQVDSVNQKYSQSIDGGLPTWESEDADDEERQVSGLVFVRHSRARTNIRLRRCSSAGCN